MRVHQYQRIRFVWRIWWRRFSSIIIITILPPPPSCVRISVSDSIKYPIYSFDNPRYQHLITNNSCTYYCAIAQRLGCSVLGEEGRGVDKNFPSSLVCVSRILLLQRSDRTHAHHKSPPRNGRRTHTHSHGKRQ